MKFEDVLNEDGTVKEFYTLPVKDEKFKQDIYLNTKVKRSAFRLRTIYWH